MAKIAIVTDSNSGITQAQAKELGISVIPMPFMIDGETYYEEITLSREDFYKRLAENADISTSQPSPDSIIQLWDNLLTTHDEIVHIPMSSGLSGSCQTAMMLAQDYDGKVQVVNNQRISVTQRQSTLDAIALAESGKNSKEIKEILENDKFNSSIYIMIDTLYYLKKGGRISSAVAFAGGILSIKPVVSIVDGEIRMLGKARGSRQGNNLLVQEIQKAGGVDFDCPVLLGYTGLTDVLLKKYMEDSRALWEDGARRLDYVTIGSVVGTHAGPGAVAVAFFRKN